MSDYLHIHQGTIHFGEAPLGPKEILLADPDEFRNCEGVKNDKQLPHRIDLVFAVGDRVAAAEMKFPADLVTSHQKRRLQRQLRNIRQVADIGILFLRDFEMEDVLAAQIKAKYHNMRYKGQPLWEDLAGFQTQGGYVLHLPGDDAEAVEFVRWYQQALTTSGVRMFAGSDRAPKPKGPGKLLQAIPGIGPKKAAELMKAYNTPIEVGQYVLTAPNEFTMLWGSSITKKIRAAFEETV